MILIALKKKCYFLGVWVVWKWCKGLVSNLKFIYATWPSFSFLTETNIIFFEAHTVLINTTEKETHVAHVQADKKMGMFNKWCGHNCTSGTIRAAVMCAWGQAGSFQRAREAKGVFSAFFSMLVSIYSAWSLKVRIKWVNFSLIRSKRTKEDRN